ncbi:TPR-like protein [Thozetella sp. PMI_491]|nr:TPR-like protein [Thozetella sp. PMI_491]
MSSTKALLKAVGESIKQHKFDEAIEKAKEVIQKDQNTYQAHIFLAFCLDKKNKPDESEAAYLNAAKLKAKDSQAWQGLIQLYQKQGAKKLKEYQHAALQLALIYHEADDLLKCQDVVDRFVDFARTHGDRQQYVDALDLVLPESPIYPALEGRVPHPAKTYEIQAQIVESEEKKKINTLIGERRTRIGARVNEVTLEVKREVFHQSRLGYVYGQLINWTTNDDIRRTYEEKLLQYCYDRLLVWPAGEQKTQELNTVEKLANDMVIIKHPFKLAWDIAIDWKDNKYLQEWDVGILREYCTHFPDSDLSRVVSGFLSSPFSPFPRENEVAGNASLSATGDAEEESEDDEEGGTATTYIPLTEEDRLLLMTEGISSADSLFAYRLMGEYYQHLEEHESNAELMRKALDYLKGEHGKTGRQFQNTRDAFSLCLGTALVFYQSPRHHQEAKALFDHVLEHDPASTPALIGVGLIYEEEEDYDEAIDFLGRAMKRAPDNLRVRTEAAWVKALKGDYVNSKAELEACIPLLKDQNQTNKDLLAQTQYRLGSCIWNLDVSKAARKSRDGAYAYFLDALKSNLNYAPAYTSLGIYYADFAKDKKRARRCFQKAVELSSSEVTSAERLAKSFADDGDWDRVELVAQRIVDSGKVRPPPGSKPIVSFQAALRISPEDYHSWVGLGESYYSSGRYIAATKAILNAQRLEGTAGEHITGDTWFSKFLLANIRRELGEFDDAISLYREVIDQRRDEEGVAIALMQTLVESAWDVIERGLFGKSIDLAKETISFALKAPEAIKATFNYWKAIADACAVFSIVQGQAIKFPVEDISQLIGSDDAVAEYQLLKDVDGVGTGIICAKGLFSDDEKLGVDLTRCVQASILAHKRALHVASNDIHTHAVAHYNLGWAEFRAHACLPLHLRKKSSRYLKASVRCFKRAIELEAGNSEFWNSLGVVTSEINPSVSQHSFVRSLHLNERSVQAWTNLGTLALLQNDLKLANEAFTRAQSTDPDYGHAWLGQGLIALLLGDVKEARGLFTHAMDISESSSGATKAHYSVSVFDFILTSPPSVPIASLIQPIFALSQLRGLKPQELAYGHLCTLFQERTNDNAHAVDILEHICATAEADFELTDSAQSLKQFALAKTDLARSYLAVGSYEKAIEAGELAITLSSDESDNELSQDERRKARLSAHLTVGLAQYYNEDVSEAVACFEAALEESNNNPDAVCLLAQILWATGSEESRERARELLFGVIESSPNHVQSVLLLGVVGLLDDDPDTLEAVALELQTLRAGSTGLSPSDQSKVGEVLKAIAALDKNASEESILRQVQTDTILYPHLPHGWSELALSSEGEQANIAAEMALQVARKGVPPRGALDAEDLAHAYAGTGRPADAQTGIMFAPWEKLGWGALAEAIHGR